MSVHLIPTLRRQYKKRSVPVRKGDEVEVMSGERKKIKGKVERVNLSTCKVYIEGINVKKADGSEVLRPFEPSNLMITKLVLDDKMRQKAFNRKLEKSKAEAKKEKVEVKKTEAKKEKPKLAAKTKKSKPVKKGAKTKKKK
jgi:large subunit ribosomal protein L24